MRWNAGRSRMASSRSLRRLALLVVILGVITAPVTAQAAHPSTLPPSFVTYPLNNPNALVNDFQLGPDGQWWIPPFSGSTIDRVSTAGVDSPLQWGSSLLDPQITAGSDGNLWMTDFNIGTFPTNGGIDKVSPSGALLATYSDSDRPFFVVNGPGGNVWFSPNKQEIGRITPAGVITNFPIPGEQPGRVANGPDGNLWFIADNGNFQQLQAVIGRVMPSGSITTFPVPAFPNPLLGTNGEPNYLTAGPDGNIWYTDVQDGVIGRVTTGGVVTQFATPRGIAPADITAGPDGNLWFTGSSISNSGVVSVVGRITTSGQIGVFDVSSAGSPDFIRSGPGGLIWILLSGPARVASFPPSAPTPSPPDIRSLSPRYSPPSGGGQVAISGYDVGTATQVFFGSTPATTFTANGRDQLIATVPPHAVGAVDVTITTPYGTSVIAGPTPTTTGSHFFYQAANCGTPISHSTTMSADIGPCYSTGLTAVADNVTLDLNGHGVIGFQDPRDGSVVGIDLQQRSGVTIKNGTVSGFDAGIHIAGGSGSTVANMKIHDNLGLDNVFASLYGDGIMIEHSSGNHVLNNVIDHNGVFDGIGVFDPGSDGNEIAHNIVENTVGPSDKGPAGEGIIINGATGGASTAVRGNRVTNNVVRKNASGGIANINEIGGTVEYNTVTDNGTTNSFGNGIGVQIGTNWDLGPTQMVIEQNNVRGNGVDGIRLGTARGFFRGSPQGNTVTSNASVGNATNLGVDIYEGGIQGYDLHDLAPNCGTDVWTNNQWGSAGFTPSCVTASSSGPGASQGAGPQTLASGAASPAPGFLNTQAWENFLEQGRP